MKSQALQHQAHCRPAVFVLALALLFMSLGGSAHAATNMVTTTADSGEGSLRAAIAAALSGDTLIFSPELSGQTITLTSGQLVLEKSLTIDGSSLSNRLTISGNQTSRILSALGEITVVLDSLVMRDGYPGLLDLYGDNGGAIDNGCRLTVVRCEVTQNRTSSFGFGGGIMNSGNLQIFDSVISTNLTGDGLPGEFSQGGWGGGIANVGGTVTIVRSRITGNITGNGAEGDVADGGTGGGIYNITGTVSILDSTIAGNRTGHGATNETVNYSIGGLGGGIFNNGTMYLGNCTIASNATGYGYKWFGGMGGGLANAGTVTVSNCTITANFANNGGIESTNGGIGGGVENYGIMSLRHCTVVGNSVADNDAGDGSGSYGGGINNDGSLILENCVVAINVLPAGGHGPDLSNGATLEPGGVNLISNPADSGMTPGPALLTGNPRLAPLANYDNSTATMPPLPGSPLIDAGAWTTNSPTTDQRGVARPNGLLPDIGAVEAFPFSTLSLIDSDGDGIDDRLEPAYPQLTLGVNDHALDSDGDGSPDWEELYNMTDPDDPQSVFKILSLSAASGFDAATNAVFNLTLRTFPGLQYQLETSSTLTNFQPAATTLFTATNSTQTLELKLGSNRDFVRARRP